MVGGLCDGSFGAGGVAGLLAQPGQNVQRFAVTVVEGLAVQGFGGGGVTGPLAQRGQEAQGDGVAAAGGPAIYGLGAGGSRWQIGPWPAPPPAKGLSDRSVQEVRAEGGQLDLVAGLVPRHRSQ